MFWENILLNHFHLTENDLRNRSQLLCSVYPFYRVYKYLEYKRIFFALFQESLKRYTIRTDHIIKTGFRPRVDSPSRC